MTLERNESNDSVILEKLENIRGSIQKLEPLMNIVTTHQEKIARLEKDNSGHHEALDRLNPKIQKLSEAEAARNASNKTLFWAIGIFAGANFLSNIIRILWGASK